MKNYFPKNYLLFSVNFRKRDAFFIVLVFMSKKNKRFQIMLAMNNITHEVNC